MLNAQDLFSLEIEGLSKTIREYSTENFINSYSEQIINLELPKDKEKIVFILDNFLDWYEKHINEIQSSHFITNKHEHTKSLQILRELKNLLDIAG